MKLKRIKDFTNKNWYVDYKDEDGYETYGPDTHEGCTKWIQTQNARIASGEKFEIDRGPYQKEAEKVKDAATIEDRLISKLLKEKKLTVSVNGNDYKFKRVRKGEDIEFKGKGMHVSVHEDASFEATVRKTVKVFLENVDEIYGPGAKITFESDNNLAGISELKDAIYDMMAMGVESGSMKVLIDGDPCEVHFEEDDFTSISLIAPDFSAGASDEDWPEGKDWDPEALLDQGVADIVNAVREHYGEEFSFEIVPDEDEIYDSKIQDGYQEEYAAEAAIDADKVMDLYEKGVITVRIPEDVDIHEFAQACISWIHDLWGEPEVNFQYEDAEFHYRINEDDTITIHVAD